MIEEWRDIMELDNEYQISNLGRVKRSKPHTGKGFTYIGRILTTEISNGYSRLTIYKKKKLRFKIHRLVAKAFIPNPQNLPHVHHINHNRIDNQVSNLMWCSVEENNDHNIILTVDALLNHLDPNTTYTKQNLLDIVNRYRYGIGN